MNSPDPISSNTQEPVAVADRCLSVRFEDSCVLIPPGPSKSALRPRIITKSYSLPLWKTSSTKKHVIFQNLVAKVNEEANAEAQRKPFNLTVSVPSITTKYRPRRSSIPSPSSSCLSKRSPALFQSPNSSIPPSSPTSLSAGPNSVASTPIHPRPPSFPQIQPATTLKQTETIPLRPCCEACYSCVDAALAEGDGWSTQWSRGAVRRYSEGEHVHLHALHPSVFGVTHAWTPKNACDDPDGGDMPLADALTIDEVDVKRRSVDYSQASLNNHHMPPSADSADTDDEDVSPENPDTSPLEPLFNTPILQEEEDEDMLFPLLSPRTPSHSPNPTPTGSQVSLSMPHAGSQTNVGTSGSPTTLAVPAISSPLASQNSEPCTSAPSSSLPARPPLALVTPAEPALDISSPRSLSSSPVHRRQRGSSPETHRRQPQRRSSFNTVSETFLKGSASVLKGVAASMKAGPGGAVMP